MRKIMIGMLFGLLFCHYGHVQEEMEVGEIVIYPLEKSVKEKEARYSAYGLVDVYGNYELYYQGYQENTKQIEDEYFKQKVVLEETATIRRYELIFRHWLIGELFRLQEDHEKVENGRPGVISKKLVFEGKKEAHFWKVRKYLLLQTKSSWVGDRFRHLDASIFFIDMGPNKTRLFYRMTLDAQDRRSQKAVHEEVRGGIEAILKYKKVSPKSLSEK